VDSCETRFSKSWRRGEVGALGDIAVIILTGAGRGSQVIRCYPGIVNGRAGNPPKSMESLTGKIAIVTGGTRGIGRAIAEHLLRQGVSVAICGRNQESVDRVVQEMSSLGKIVGHSADISRPEEVSKFFQTVDKELGGLDILINNAGQATFRKVGEMTPEEWHYNIDLNLNGVFYCSHEALPRFAKRGGGFIVNISSLAGKNAFTGGAGYNASKAGLKRRRRG
jgi:3-oxoacyl-[acyl-carrier protein] reductase